MIDVCAGEVSKKMNVYNVNFITLVISQSCCGGRMPELIQMPGMLQWLFNQFDLLHKGPVASPSALIRTHEFPG